MTSWQRSLVDHLSGQLGAAAVRPYGSVVDGGLDGWSDLDVVLEVDRPFEAGALLGGRLWAWQDVRDGADQVLRAVLADGRRVDARVVGEPLRLPAEPVDLAVRFDAALARTRIARGADLVGLHLVLGVLREVLVLGMLRADADAGTDHHRAGTRHDALARRVGALVASTDGAVPVGAPRAACELYGAERRLLDPTYAPDWSGLTALEQLAAGWARTGETTASS